MPIYFDELSIELLFKQNVFLFILLMRCYFKGSIWCYALFLLIIFINFKCIDCSSELIGNSFYIFDNYIDYFYNIYLRFNF